MSIELSLDDIVTEFLLSTCQLCPASRSQHAVVAALLCGKRASAWLDEDDPDVAHIPLITGSFAEFYIKPILPLFGDIDVMLHENTQLAIPRGHPPPTQLPDEFHNYVHVHEIIDSPFLGYVYLEFRYLLTQCSDDDNYNAVEYDRGQYLLNRPFTAGKGVKIIKFHGPAIGKSAVLRLPGESAWLSLDQVPCVRCLMWPSQAADWPTRHRNYNWPDSATLDRVVSNGCDVVPVAHRQCRQHERWPGFSGDCHSHEQKLYS